MFVGREFELELLDTTVMRVRSGSTELRLVAGPPGIGKTRLVEVFVRRARDEGAAVGVGRAFELGGAPPLWPLTEALRELALAHPDSASLPRAIACLERTAELDATRSELERLRFEQLEVMRQTLAGISKHRTTIVVIEDVHAADASTLIALRHLERHLRGASVLVLLTARDAPAASAEVASLVAELGRADRRIDLAGLDRSALSSLVTDFLGSPAQTSLLDAIETATGGNPFFVTELMGASQAKGQLDAMRAGIIPSALPLTSGVRELIRVQAAKLPRAARSLLRVAAVLGRSVSAHLVAAVSHTSELEVIDAFGHGVDARLLVPGDVPSRASFAHALICDALAADLPETERMAIHARALDALLAPDRPVGSTRPAALARHGLGAAGLGPRHATRAITWCRAAGHDAMLNLAFEEAERYIAAALATLDAAGGDDAARAELMVELGEAQLGTDAPARSAEVFVAAAALALPRAPETFARAALGCAATREFMTRDIGMLRLLEQAASLLGDARTELSVRVQCRLAADLTMEPASRARRDTLSRRALETARAIASPRLVALALDARLKALYGADNLLERLELGEEIGLLARASGDREREAGALAWKLSAVLELGRVDDATTLAHEHMRLADERRVVGPRINALSRLATLSFMRGDLDAGLRSAEAALALGPASDRAAQLLFSAQVAVPALHFGRRDLLTACLPVLVAEGPRMHTAHMLRAVAARVHLGLGQIDEARAILESLVGPTRVDIPDDFVRLGTLATLALVAVELADRARAQVLRDALAPYHDRFAYVGTAQSLGPMSAILGALAACLGAPRDALTWFLAAYDAARRACARPYEALVSFEIARLGQAIGDTALAARHLAIADELARTLAMPALREALVAHAASSVGMARITCVLRKSGQGWTIVMPTREVLFRGQRGFELLARLVSEPGRELLALELARDPGHEAPPRESGLELLDPRAKAALQERIADLDDRIASAEAMGDAERARVANDERTAIVAHLAGALGLGRRARRTGDALERARVAVKVALKRVVASVARELPDIGEHLERSLRTGSYCAYDPDPSGVIRMVYGS